MEPVIVQFFEDADRLYGKQLRLLEWFSRLDISKSKVVEEKYLELTFTCQAGRLRMWRTNTGDTELTELDPTRGPACSEDHRFVFDVIYHRANRRHIILTMVDLSYFTINVETPAGFREYADDRVDHSLTWRDVPFFNDTPFTMDDEAIHTAAVCDHQAYLDWRRLYYF